MISFDRLCKRYGRVTALDNVSLTIRSGAVTAIAGPNGSGKTTLIKTILGMVKPDSGTLKLGGISLNGHHEYRRLIGYMPQHAQFPENIRASEVIDLVKSLRGRDARIDNSFVSRLKLDGSLDRKVGTLSGGTRQRLSAAIAFMFLPDLIILDEPTAGLDPISSRILKDEIANHRSGGGTAIVSTHILSDIEELADEVIFLHDGKCVFSGSVRELADRTGERRLERSFVALLGEKES